MATRKHFTTEFKLEGVRAPSAPVSLNTAGSRRAAPQAALAVCWCLAAVQRSSFSLAPLIAGFIAASWPAAFAVS